jgi:putative nucleotidyltransferase with HDIG domain
MKNEKYLEEFKKIVIKNCSHPSFVYHEFFVNDHLLLVERIAMELCDKYPEADREVVLALAWFHDFGKPIDIDNEAEKTLSEGVKALKVCGFENSFIDNVVAIWRRVEMKNEIDISKEPIEVQIISSADGASHFAGKFFATYFRDNPAEPLEDIEDRIRKKIKKDWEKKITLPEIKQAFYARYLLALEIAGEYPERFI